MKIRKISRNKAGHTDTNSLILGMFLMLMLVLAFNYTSIFSTDISSDLINFGEVTETIDYWSTLIEDQHSEITSLTQEVEELKGLDYYDEYRTSLKSYDKLRGGFIIMFVITVLSAFAIILFISCRYDEKVKKINKSINKTLEEKTFVMVTEHNSQVKSLEEEILNLKKQLNIINKEWELKILKGEY